MVFDKVKDIYVYTRQRQSDSFHQFWYLLLFIIMKRLSNRLLWNILLLVATVCLITYLTIFCCLETSANYTLNIGQSFLVERTKCQQDNKTASVSENCSGKMCFRHLSPCALDHVAVKKKHECQVRKLLVYKCETCCCGGWGDRLKGIISTFLLAILTDRVFVIDMKQPCDLDSILDYNVYDWSICKSFARSHGTTRTVDITKPRNKLVPDLSKEDFDDTWTEKVIGLKIRVYVIEEIKMHQYVSDRLEWIKNMSSDEIAHILMNTLFKEGNGLLKSKDKMLQSSGLRRKLACAHIRIGRNPSNPNDKMTDNGIYKKEITTIFSFLERYAQDSRFSVYIATDSDSVKRLARNIHHLLLLNRSIVHIDLPNEERFSSVVCEGLFTALLEHYLLASCDILVLTRSNFGTTAAYMRGTDKGLFVLSHQNNKRENGIIKVNLDEIQNLFGYN